MKPEREFFSPETGDIGWRPAAGDATGSLRELVLAPSAESEVYTRLLKFDAGCDTSPNGIVRHDFWEEVWIVSGTLRDLSLGKDFAEGSYACRPPGMPHGPWASPGGAMTFEVRYRAADPSRGEPTKSAYRRVPSGAGLGGSVGTGRTFVENCDVDAYRVRVVEGVANLGDVFTKRLVAGEQMTLLEMKYGLQGGAPDHIHRHETLGYIVRGRVAVSVAGTTRELGPGDGFIHPANTPHGILALEPSVVLEIKSPVEDMTEFLTLEKVED